MITLALPRFSYIIGVVFIAILLFFYIFQITEVTKVGFLVSNYEKQIVEFAQESKILESDFSQLNSLVNLEIILSGFNYEKIEKIHYLRMPGSQVAAK